MNNFKKYLPSKKFITVLLVIVVFIILFFTIRGVVSLFRSKIASKGQQTKLTIETPTSISQKDSNNNGVPDWEEYMWGLDPTKNGPSNKEYIATKRQALMDSGAIIPDDSKAITDNERLSQEFLATIVSLQQTGSLDQDSMNSVSEAIGKNVVATPIADIYTSSMLMVKSDSTIANNAYSDALTALITKYKDADIGSELTFIIQGLENKDPQALYAASTVGDAYQSFGKDFMKIPVPKSLAVAHLSAANDYEKTGETIKDLSKMLSDPIIGMKALINYKKYNDALASDLEKISEILQ
jgi:ABC-type Na+ efflux pump permease subunit